MRIFKNLFVLVSVLVLVGAVAINPAVAAKIKNVIVLIPDGCSQSTLTLARWYKGEKLTVDDLYAGVVKHEMANSVITGSAAAGTAFAAGYKTTARFLGIGPREDDVLSTYIWPEDPATFSYKPIVTVLEAAKLDGKATGLISTSRFTHATPAAYACHSNDRGNEHTDISEHMVYNEVDLIFGGGERNLVPKSMGGKRTDEEDLRDVLADRGYTIARTKGEMDVLTSLPTFGMFAWSHMDAEIDRAYQNLEEPSLSEMTTKAIELLSQNKKGFFLMVEGSQVDWAGHNNDPVYMATDFIEFDKAVEVALDFAKQDGKTLILAFPDHNTGGMDIGNRAYNSGSAYTSLTVETLLDPIKGMDVTAGYVADTLCFGAYTCDFTDQQLIDAVQTYWNMAITEADAQEIRDMMNGDAGSLSYALARIISKNYTAIGWTSHGHNAEDVPLWAYGPGAPQTGLYDNTELAGMVADALDLNMKRAQRKLFVNLDDVFGEA
ncbi:MAG: alkaline phosphatase, partial [Desulfosarcina sp.]